MGSRPPSKTIGPGTKPPSKRTAGLALFLVGAATLLAGCSHSDVEVEYAQRCDRLLPGTTYSADLDNDKVLEFILVDDARVKITDGSLVYRSREKWDVVDSSLGDVDGDGFLEVVTLVDDDEGRHIGLFAFFGGEYRERIVTSEIPTRPAGLQVCNAEHPGIYEELIPADLVGDLVVLTGESAEAGGPPAFLRWNGFGFTAVPLDGPVTEP